LAVLGVATHDFLCSRERTPVSSHLEAALKHEKSGPLTPPARIGPALVLSVASDIERIDPT
jgi:hypothetical protein